jgi:hypothetical protein
MKGKEYRLLLLKIVSRLDEVFPEENTMPKQFDANELNQLANANEIEIETRPPSGRPHRTTIWVVVDDNNVYVRSVRGRNGRWYQRITANPDAAIHVGGRRLAVHAVPVTGEAMIASVSSAFLRKYRSSPATNSIVRQEILPTTLRLEPT